MRRYFQRRYDGGRHLLGPADRIDLSCHARASGLPWRCGGRHFDHLLDDRICDRRAHTRAKRYC